MNGPLVRIRLDGNGRVYHPSETLSGDYRVESVTRDEIKAIEVSVLWYSEGKGDEDLAVHEFWRIAADDDASSGDFAGTFRTVMPNSPLSYRGVLVRIRWCVRVRVFLTRGREVMGELAFRLGELPSVRMPAPHADTAEQETVAQTNGHSGPNGRGNGQKPSNGHALGNGHAKALYEKAEKATLA
jgi:hypothetical protein